jgi:hypothetical protein
MVLARSRVSIEHRHQIVVLLLDHSHPKMQYLDSKRGYAIVAPRSAEL